MHARGNSHKLNEHFWPVLRVNFISFQFICHLESLKKIDLYFVLNPYGSKDLGFLGELFNRSALLPHLTTFSLHVNGRIEMEDLERWELVG